MYRIELESGTGDYFVAYVRGESAERAVEAAREVAPRDIQDVYRIQEIGDPSAGVVFATETRHEDGKIDELVISPEPTRTIT